jgi:two-component system, cell cycle sensor histidine kinase and response regulator CckA
VVKVVQTLQAFRKARASVAVVQPAAPGRVLVVDDDDSVREFVTRALKEAGYEITSAGSGPEAIRLADESAGFDMLLTDMMMPRMSGADLAGLLRQQRPGLKVLYLTGYSDRLFGAKNVLWTDEAFLEKPCSVESLLEAVALLLVGRLR